MSEKKSGRVLGVGGIFFRSKDPARLGDWYAECLGFEIEAWGETRGTSFSPLDMPRGSFTVWSAFESATEYFGTSGQGYMINLVVDDLDSALATIATLRHPVDAYFNDVMVMADDDAVRNAVTSLNEAGTVVASTPTANGSGSLAVCRGAQIFVNGTAQDPVIMTSTEDDFANWREACNEWGNLTDKFLTHGY